jgi:TetR/AcrR family transcriptional regulator, transcriptional repressor of bet genes
MDRKADQRRTQLAESALQTLSELGYARTSVRDIAQNSDFSHGVLHYYFKDKAELIVHSVRLYKTRCATRYDYVVATATTPEELVDGFVAKLRESLVNEATMHRLWYDLRAQGMYIAEYQPDILEIDALLEDMTWRVVSRYAELLGREVALPPDVVYGALDGVFQKALLHYLSGDEDAPTRLGEQARGALPLFVAAG